MRRIFVLTFLLIIGINKIQGQEKIDELNYPNGIYETKMDFISGTPSGKEELKVKEVELVTDIDSIVERCFFYNKQTNKKVKKAFAISHDGCLYFRTGAILKYKNKKDKSLSGTNKEFVLVRLVGENFLYAEAGLVNPWKYGVSGGVAHGVGGIIGSELGSAIEKSYPKTTYGGTGLVWDFKKQEFNIFRNCDDYNEFIKNFSIEKLDCGKETFDLNRIRNDIETIK